MNRQFWTILVIVLFGLVIRIWHVGSIPPGLNRDEASIGYTAYSLLKTGKDEYGVSFPLSFKSFGDWKLPLYIYLDIFPVKYFSLNEISVRLPSIILGSLTIIILYFLSLEIFPDEKRKRQVALLAAFLLAISPWHIHFSRVASEANLAVFLVTLSLLLFLKGLSKPTFLLFSSLTLSLSLYTYHGNHIFTPLLFLGLMFIVVKNKIGKKALLLFLLPFIIFSSIIYQKTLLSADKTKISGLTPLSDISLVYENVVLARLDHMDFSSIPAKIFHNKLILLVGKFFEGYLRSFSPEFLFLKGGGNWQHNIPNFGNLYIWESPFIILGLYFLFHKNFKWRWFLLFWLLISPIPASLTRDAPHSARMLSFLPLPHLLAAVGFLEIFLFLKSKKFTKIGMIIGSFLILNLVIYLDRYFIHFPKALEAEWGGGYKELVASVTPLLDKYKEIVVDNPNYSPYIYFLFYQKTDPEVYQKEVIRYDVDTEGFHHVESFKNLKFKKLDWAEDLLVPDRLLVSWVESTPKGATDSAVLVDKLTLTKLETKFGQSFGLEVGDMIKNKLIKAINLSNGKPQFYLIEVVRIPKGIIDLNYEQK